MIPVLFVWGPTAVGKTEYSIRLAEDLGGEIVSADSMQIYRFMDIGSAKPTREEQTRVPHHLVDFADPREPFSVAMYQKLALDAIKDVASRGKVPVVSGGTGLYINSLIYDMDFSAPAGDPALRDKILAEEGNDPARLWERLRRLDPAAADEIHPNNVKRVLRAIERLEGGEEKLRGFAEGDRPSKIVDPVLIGLDRDRDELYKRIDARVDRLFEAGLADEIRSLMAMGLSASDISMKGIGYKEVIEAVNAGFPPESAAEKIKLSTRHYAKRQLTWLRRYKDMKWFTLKGDGFCEDVYRRILDYGREKTQAPQPDR